MQVRHAQGLCCDLHSGVVWAVNLSFTAEADRMGHWLFARGLHLCVRVERGGGVTCCVCLPLLPELALCGWHCCTMCAMGGGEIVYASVEAGIAAV